MRGAGSGHVQIPPKNQRSQGTLFGILESEAQIYIDSALL